MDSTLDETQSMERAQEKPKARRRKVDIACVYCRRSHMICDDSRPCQRCIKRNIGHLCHDEPVSERQRKKMTINSESPSMTPSSSQPEIPYNGGSLASLTQHPVFFSEHVGNEFSSLNEFLSMIDDPELMSNVNYNNDPMLQGLQQIAPIPRNEYTGSEFNGMTVPQQEAPSDAPIEPYEEQNIPNVSESARDKFFLTAADPTTEISPEERLKQVINAKLEAGLLRPYNYAKGYARLQSYMDNYMNSSSRQRILKPLSTFRPGFRAIAKTLKDIDLILVEENFERMLLDYDRVFTSMAIPACLWRRTGEIYRGNKEFASLVEVPMDELKNGKLTIYELMTEESSVNYWEKYGSIAFDKTQKAVLTSCNLRSKDGRKRRSCCFSFTIRRDRYNIPSCIVGNFIPTSS